MKSPPFDYARPDTLDEALALLGDEDVDTMALAGGQSLVPMMNFRMAAPERLVDLNRIAAFSGVSDEGDTLRIKAMTRYATLHADPLIAAHVPLFTKALPHIAHAAIRNRGTLGGSCALADPAAEMPAVLTALDATLVVTSLSGQRQIKADAFFLGIYDTALEHGELITDILVPKATAADRYGFYELARRHGDYAMAGVVVAGRGAPALDSCRVVFFSVADKATRATAIEAALIGVDPASVSTEAAQAFDLSEIAFTGDLNADVATKKHLSRVVLTRALAEM